MKKHIYWRLITLAVLLSATLQAAAQEPYAVLDGTELTFYYDDQKDVRGGMNVGPFSSSSSRGWNGSASTITSVVFDESFESCTSLTSTANWFFGFTKLTTITGIGYLNTANVTNMSGMFGNCSSLENLDVSGFNTAKVKSFNGMFRDCRKLSSLAVSGFNTEAATDMSNMFYWCSGLESLDVSGFNTDKVTNIKSMFNGCSSLKSLDVSSINTSKVSDLSEMFQGCSSLTSLDVSGLNTDNVTNMSNMFRYCSSLTSLNLGDNFNTAGVTTMEYMFSGCSVLTGLDLSSFNTEKVTNMGSMFNGCSGLTSLDLSNFNTASVTVMSEMFHGCSSLTSLNFGDNFNTENVVTMYWMFGNCSSLESLDVSGFNTVNVTEMPSMFSGCSSLTTLDVNNFDISKVTSLGSMFKGCSALTNLGVNQLNTSNIEYMGNLFSGCSSLTSLDLSNFNTAIVKDMSSMFYGCTGLTSLDLSNFNTANVTKMSQMFDECTGLTTIFVDDDWSTEAVTSSSNMFRNCTSLVGGKGTAFDPYYSNDATFAYIDDPDNDKPGYFTRSGEAPYKAPEPYAVLTDNDDEVTTDAGVVNGKTLTFYYDGQKETRDGMDLTDTPWRANETKDLITKVVFDASFADCTSLTTTDNWFNECTNLATIENISNLKTENVTDMNTMFRMCTSLTSIDFANFDTSSSTSLHNMFFGCTGLTSLDLSHFNTASVEDMHSMFAGCTQLTTLDLSNFDTSNLTNIQGMFSGCDLLETVDLSSWNTANVTDIRYLFNYCPKLTTVYVGANWNLSSVTDTDNGISVFNNCISIMGGQGTTYSTAHTDYTYAHIDGGTDNPGYLTDISSRVPYAALTENDDDIENSGNTYTLTFYYDGLKSYRGGLDVGAGAYGGPAVVPWSEAILDITSVVFDKTFADCTTLTSTAYWFYLASELKSITGISNLKTDNVTDMYGMFADCSNLTILDLSHFKTNNVTNMRDMFVGCSGLTSLDVSGFNTENVTDMGRMFNSCSNLTSLDVSGFNTENVEDMWAMFAGCSKLTSLDLSNFNTEKVTNMRDMFYNCRSLASLDLSGFNTSNVSGIASMFSGCSSLTNLDLSHFNTSNVDDLYEMFWGCSNLTDLNISGFDTGKVTNMGHMFTNCSSLTSLDVSSFNTSNVTKMNDMFYGCSGLKSLDLSTFKTDKVVNMDEMFYGCNYLRTIFVSDDWVTTNVNSSSNMFNQCFKLVGGAGTIYNVNKRDATYARIDNGPGSDNPGYFTRSGEEPYVFKEVCAVLTDNNDDVVIGDATVKGKTLTFYFNRNIEDINNLSVGPFNSYQSWYNERESITSVVFDDSFANCTSLTSTAYWFDGCKNLTGITGVEKLKTDNVTDMSAMFSGCSGLTSLDVNNFNTANVTSMGYMFNGCSGLTSLDVCNFNTANVTSMGYMFNGCSGLTSLDLSNFNTANVTSMGSMFRICSQLKTIYVANGWNTEAVTSSYDMFTGCTNLVGGAGTAYNIGHRDAAYARIDGGTDNPGYFTDKREPYAVLNDDNTVLTFYYDYEKEDKEGALSVGPFSSSSSQSWYSDRASITSVIFDDSFANCTSITSTAYWFSGCSKLTSITGIENLKTDNVTDMTAMFYDCNELSSLDLSSFNTAKVISMSDMFVRCLRLKSLNLNNFSNDQVENMSNMFFSCTGLTSLDLSGFKTASVTNMHEMFYACSGLTSLDLSSFNTSNVTDMGRMFEHCSSLTSIDLSGCNTENVADMRGMFWQCSALKTIYASSEWSTNSVTDSGIMFEYCFKLVGGQGTKYAANNTNATYARIDDLPDNPGYFTRSGDEPYIEPEAYAVLSDNNTVLTFYYNRNKGTDALSIGSFSSITDRGWNDESGSITKVVIDDSFADYKALTNTARWFEGLSNLTSIEGAANLVTSRVTDMTAMFSGCSSLTSIDVSGFNTVNVTKMTSMFQDCSNLQTIYVGKDWVTKESTVGKNMFAGCTNLVGGAATIFSEDAIDKTYAHVDGGADNPGYFSLSENASQKDPEPYALLSDDGTVLSLYYDDMKSSHIILNMISIDGGFMYNNIGWPYGTSQTVTTVVFDPSFADCRLKNLNSMFSSFTKLSTINGIEYLNTSEVTDMYMMFFACSSLTSVDLSHFNTSNVVNMCGMFQQCYALETLDLSSFSTPNLRDISDMFLNDGALKTILVGSGWNTSSITNPDSLDITFKGCTALVGGKGTAYSASNVNGTYARIDGGPNSSTPGYFTRSGDAPYKAPEPYAALIDNDDDVVIDGATVKGKTLTFYYDGNKEDRSGVSVGPFDYSSSQSWYDARESITSVVFDDSFANCTSITSTAYWFCGCKNLTGITGIENLKTDNVTNMSYMFSDCSSLTGLDVSHFNTQSVTNMYAIFSNCSSLTSLDVSGFKTDNVTLMNAMFSNCSSLTSLDVSGFNTGNVTTMEQMFWYCSGLTSLDVSSFNTTNVTNMVRMFCGCSSLTTIYADSGWTTENVSSSGSMFYGCSNLIGGFGTSVDGSYLDHTYARIDGGTSNPGYFTDKNATIWSVIGTINGNWDTDTRMESTDGVHFTAKFTGKDIGIYQFKVRANESWDIQYPNNGDPSDGGADPASVAVELENQSTITVMFNAETGAITTDVTGVYCVPGRFNGWDPGSAEEMTKGSDGIYSLTIDNLTAGETYEYKIAVNHSWDISYGVDGRLDGSNLSFTVPDGETSVTIYFNAESKLATTEQPTGIIQAYALLSGGKTTLTFYYDDLKEWRQGMDVGPFMHYSNRPWQSAAETITTVIFDESFAQCDTLKSIAWWLYELTNLTQVSRMENLKTDNVTDMSHFLSVSWSLTSIDLSHFNTTNVTNMEGMFTSCWALTNLDVSKFNTEKVTNMAGMFNGLKSITSLDIRNFNTTNVTNMEGMFASNPDLTTIYVGDGWTVASVTSGEGVFNGCTSLVGGMGTPYDADHIDADYAHIDGGEENPGYFTSIGIPGDVNGDGVVNIADAQAMVSYILGTYEDTFDVNLADMNGDGAIDIFDVTLVVNITLDDDTDNPSGSRVMTRGDISQAELMRVKAENNEIGLAIDEAERYTAFQFDLKLPEGVELTSVKLASEIPDYLLKFVKHQGNRYRVIGLSLTNEVLSTIDGQLIKLLVSDSVDETDVSIDNVLFVTPGNKVVTHIGAIEYHQQAEDGNIYNLNGQRMNANKQQLRKGIYIINHKKVIIK